MCHAYQGLHFAFVFVFINCVPVRMDAGMYHACIIGQPYQGLRFSFVFVFIFAFAFVFVLVFAFVFVFINCVPVRLDAGWYHVSALSGPARLLQPSSLTPTLYL